MREKAFTLLVTLILLFTTGVAIIDILAERPTEVANSSVWSTSDPPQNVPLVCAWTWPDEPDRRDYYEVVRAGSAYVVYDLTGTTICVERRRPVAWAYAPLF